MVARALNWNPGTGAMFSWPGASMVNSYTQGALTGPESDLWKQPERPLYRLITQSIGAAISDYTAELIATASAHTLVDSLLLPRAILIRDAVDDQHVGNSDNSKVTAIQTAVAEIKSITGLPKKRIASDILDISRTALYDWAQGKNLEIDNEQRLFETLDILRRAFIRHPSQDEMRAWLFTPVGSHAVSPAQLFRAGALDEARLLAIASMSARQESLPEWLLSAPINKWSAHDQRRRNLIASESNLGPNVDDEVL